MKFFNIRVDDLSIAGVVDEITRACENRKQLQVVTVNLNFITLALKNQKFYDVINRAEMSVADGRILMWVAKLQGDCLSEQITGHDLFEECVKLAFRNSYRIFLLGGAPGVAEHVSSLISQKYPGLDVFGTDGGVFSNDGVPEDEMALKHLIEDFRPDIIFVALGAPKQDLWIAENLKKFAIPVGIGVGCVFDVVGGRLKRAPRWVQILGLESPFQLLHSPKRYARRYLIDDPPTLLLLIWNAVKIRFF